MNRIFLDCMKTTDHFGIIIFGVSFLGGQFHSCHQPLLGLGLQHEILFLGVRL